MTQLFSVIYTLKIIHFFNKIRNAKIYCGLVRRVCTLGLVSILGWEHEQTTTSLQHILKFSFLLRSLFVAKVALVFHLAYHHQINVPTPLYIWL